jgi:hypothetical protein
VSLKTFSYSAFLRGPTKVLPSLDNADVTLERGDDENFVLLRAKPFEVALRASGSRRGS